MSTKVTNMSFMFNACGEMVGYSVGANTWYVGDISNWNTAKVTTFAFMFNEAAKYNGSATVPLNLSRWNTGSATDMQYMFSFAWNAKSYTQDLSGWNVSKVTSYANFNAYIGSKVICPAFR